MASPLAEVICPGCKGHVRSCDAEFCAICSKLFCVNCAEGDKVQHQRYQSQQQDIKIEGLNAPLPRVVEINAPPEELKAFEAGCRVGYKTGFSAGYAQRIAEEDKSLGIEPSEVLFNKPS